MQEAFDSVRLVVKSIEDGMPEDFYSIDLMSAYASLGKIIGKKWMMILWMKFFLNFVLESKTGY